MATLPALSDQIQTRLSSDFSNRCVALARTAHLDGAARLEAIRAHTIIWTVPSKDRSREYDVVTDYAGAVWCDCPAAEHNRHCSHAGAAIVAMRQMAQACKAYAVPASAA